jgi:hypothetical protein
MFNIFRWNNTNKGRQDDIAIERKTARWVHIRGMNKKSE